MLFRRNTWLPGMLVVLTVVIVAFLVYLITSTTLYIAKQNDKYAMYRPIVIEQVGVTVTTPEAKSIGTAFVIRPGSIADASDLLATDELIESSLGDFYEDVYGGFGTVFTFEVLRNDERVPITFDLTGLERE